MHITNDFHRQSEIAALLASLPKTELHVHLDGSVLPQTLRELALEQSNPLPPLTGKELSALMQADEQCGSLPQYLSKFSFVLPYLQTSEALERTAYELVMQAASHNVQYIEARFAPQLHTAQGLTAEAAVEAVLRGLKRGEKTFGTMARAIVICLRSHSEELNIAAVHAAYAFYGKGVVAVDLAGDEAAFPPHQFRRLFAIVREHSMPITIHAGEAAGADNVREAITGLGALRIGHGVRMKEDDEVIKLVKQSGVALEMCPISNLQTRAVADWGQYPIREYIAQGIAVTVNTDNMTVSDTSLVKEFEALIIHCGLTLSEVAAIIMNGAKAAFLEPERKSELVNRFDRALAEAGIG